MRTHGYRNKEFSFIKLLLKLLELKVIPVSTDWRVNIEVSERSF